MKLITEYNQALVTPTMKNGKKSYYIEGVFLQSNKTNRNGRVYPLAIMEAEVNRYNREMIVTNRALGELGHPENATINFERSSHIIKSLIKEGNDFIGKAKVMDTPYGKIAQVLIDEEVKLGVSSRALGSLTEKNGVSVVGDDFHLTTAADIVGDPSAPDAFVRGIVENKEWVWNSGILTEQKCESVKKSFEKKFKEEVAIKEFGNFLDSISRPASAYQLKRFTDLLS